ncbi:MAG: hypothetical protein ABSG14_08175 [Verrucomicrobiia bacterium]|jgi:hypothetical protein
MMKRRSLIVVAVIANSFLPVFASDAQHTNFFNDGSRFVGELHDGKPNGTGTMILSDGLKLVGQFKDGIIDGQGKMIYPNGTLVEALWKGGKLLEPSDATIYPDIGPLGYVVGTPLTIEGTHPAEFLSATCWAGFHLDVSQVNGEQLAKPIRIVLYNVNNFSKFELSSNVVYRLQGEDFCFKGCSFVISEVVSPPGYVLSYGIVKKSE